MMKVIVGLVFSLLIVIPLTLTIWLLITAARSATTHIGFCKGCHYDLRGLKDRRDCPECGRPFSVNERGDIVS